MVVKRGDHMSFNANYKLDKNFVQPLPASINSSANINNQGNNTYKQSGMMNNEELC